MRRHLGITDAGGMHDSVLSFDDWLIARQEVRAAQAGFEDFCEKHVLEKVFRGTVEHSLDAMNDSIADIIVSVEVEGDTYDFYPAHKAYVQVLEASNKGFSFAQSIFLPCFPASSERRRGSRSMVQSSDCL